MNIEQSQNTFEKGGIIFKQNADLYIESDKYIFPTCVREGATAEHIKDDVKGRELYSRPTEPYDLKMKFLQENGILGRKNIFTILGANWPLFYADLMGSDISIMTVDENERQVDFLNTFLEDLDKFDSIFEENDITFFNSSGVPYYPTNYRDLKISLGERLRNLKAVKSKQLKTEIRKKNEIKAQEIKSKILEIINRGDLKAVVADIRRAAEDIDLSGIDFVDLSNVPELIGPEATIDILNNLDSGVLVYMAFLTFEVSAEDFVKKLSGYKLIDISRTNDQRQRMVVLEKE